MRTVLLPLVAALLATGCDVISPPYTEESPADTGTAGAFVQKVLLEDYTGFRCGNCPEAHERAQELQARYPGRVAGTASFTDLAYVSARFGIVGIREVL
jgi:hypothetical protein